MFKYGGGERWALVTMIVNDQIFKKMQENKASISQQFRARKSMVAVYFKCFKTLSHS